MAWRDIGSIPISSPPTGMICCVPPGHSKWERSTPQPWCRHYSGEGVRQRWDVPLQSLAAFQKRYIYQLRGIQLINREEQAYKMDVISTFCSGVLLTEVVYLV